MPPNAAAAIAAAGQQQPNSYNQHSGYTSHSAAHRAPPRGENAPAAPDDLDLGGGGGDDDDDSASVVAAELAKEEVKEVNKYQFSWDETVMKKPPKKQKQQQQLASFHISEMVLEKAEVRQQQRLEEPPDHYVVPDDEKHQRVKMNEEGISLLEHLYDSTANNPADSDVESTVV